MASRATKETMIKREKRIQELMALGKDRQTILATVAQEENIMEKSVETQYYQIINELQKLVKENRYELRANLMARQEAIYQKAMEKNALKMALEATAAQAKLGGLYDADVVQDKKSPEVIVFKEKEFSKPLAVVPNKVENE